MPLFSAVAPLPVNRIKNRLFDPDARDYILRVEAADGERLESQVRGAINAFVLGCKADGIWTSLVTSCIMAGARTVAGAITPLVGNAPTNNNFVIGDYSRTLGLLSNDSNKYLATGYNTADTTNFPQNNCHLACYVSVSQTDSGGTLLGGPTGAGNRLFLQYNTTTNIQARNRGTVAGSNILAPLGFQGTSRNNSANFECRFTSSLGVGGSSIVTSASGNPTSDLIGVFATGVGGSVSAVRMSFYSMGKSLSLSLLDFRVTTLMNTLASVIA